MRIDKAKFAYELARREWRQGRLSEISGVSRATISAIASGKSIAFDTAKKIARAFNIPLEALLEEDVSI